MACSSAVYVEQLSGSLHNEGLLKLLSAAAAAATFLLHLEPSVKILLWLG